MIQWNARWKVKTVFVFILNADSTYLRCVKSNDCWILILKIDPCVFQSLALLHGREWKYFYGSFAASSLQIPGFPLSCLPLSVLGWLCSDSSFSDSHFGRFGWHSHAAGSFGESWGQKFDPPEADLMGLHDCCFYVYTWKSHGNMYLEIGEFDGVCCCLSWSGLLQFRLCVFLTEGLLKAETFQLFDGIPSSSVFASRSISSTSSSVSSSSSFSLSLSMSSACSIRESFSRGFSTGGGRGLGGGGGGFGGAGASWRVRKSAGHLLWKNPNCRTIKIVHWSHLCGFSFDDWLLTEKTCDNCQLLPNFVAEKILVNLTFEREACFIVRSLHIVNDSELQT